MEYLQNLHTHTIYCDGKDTPEEMIEAAISKGFSSIGFSGHSYLPDSDYTMSKDGTTEYKKELENLKIKYAGKIEIFCGLEADIFSSTDLSGYDYLIGSVHCLNCDGKLLDVDFTLEKTREIIDEYFKGDGILYAKEYYKTLAKLPEYGKFDIIGHIDLITKFSEKASIFDTNSKEYKNAVIETLEALQGKIPYFEVNTGAISRGYRTTPYPDENILKELKRLGFGAVITSDCHNKNMLDCNFKEAEILLKNYGFKEKYILTADGFKSVELQ